jgi:hypothetical protein
LNLRPLVMSHTTTRLRCLGESLVSALTSADLRDDVDSVPPCLPRLKLSRCVRFTNRFTELLPGLRIPVVPAVGLGENPLLSPLLSAAFRGTEWAGTTRLCAWCENPIPARALRDAVASNWADAGGKAPRSFGRVRWIVADL